MEKIYFPLEKTIFLPRGKAPIGKMEHFAASAEVQAIEPAQTGWLCYGRLTIALEYLPMGRATTKGDGEWRQISQALLSMGKEEKERCIIEADFIQELPDRPDPFAEGLVANIQKKHWQQIASNALEIQVEVMLTCKEKKRIPVEKRQDFSHNGDILLSQDHFLLEDLVEGRSFPADALDDMRAKKNPDGTNGEAYYYAAEDPCEQQLQTDEGRNRNEPEGKQGIAFCPEELVFSEEGMILEETCPAESNGPEI